MPGTAAQYGLRVGHDAHANSRYRRNVDDNLDLPLSTINQVATTTFDIHDIHSLFAAIGRHAR